MFEQAVMRALDDAQAEIARMTEGIEPRPLRHRLRLEDQMALGLARGPQYCQVIHHIDAEHRRHGRAAGHIDDIDAITFRRMHQFGNHMVVGDDPAVSVGIKTRCPWKPLPRSQSPPLRSLPHARNTA